MIMTQWILSYEDDGKLHFRPIAPPSVKIKRLCYDDCRNAQTVATLMRLLIACTKFGVHITRVDN